MEKKKILIFSYKLPYPLSQGGAIAQYFFLEKLIDYYDLTFCTIVNNESQIQSLNLLKEKIPALNVKFLEKKIIKKTFKQRINKLLKRIKNKIQKVLILKTNDQFFSNKIDFSITLDEESVTFFKSLFINETYDLVQLDFYESLILLPIVPERIKKIVIHHEIRSKRNKLLKIEKSDHEIYLEHFNEIIENALLENADSIVVFNEEDKEYLKLVSSKIFISPFGIPKDLIKKEQASKSFNKFLFIGGEFHYPNKEGLEWFLDTIYLKNKDKIKWPIYIIGYWSNTIFEKYSDYQNIIFCGYVSDVELVEYYEDSVMIVPVLSGSGIRTKILTSLANKTPIFSTNFASEGLLFSDKSNNHITLFNNEEEFINVFQESSNEKLEALSNNGYDYYCNTFDDEKLIALRIKAIENTVNESSNE